MQIASRDTLIRRRLPEVHLPIIDEGHDQRGAINALLDGVWKDMIVIGLSATPWSRGLGLRWDKFIVAATLKQMIQDGPVTGLCPMRVMGVPVDPDRTGIKRTGDDLDEAASARVMNTPVLVGNAVDHWLRTRQEGEHPGDRTFLRGVNRAHAKSLMEALRAAGISCGYIDGESSSDVRRDELTKYRSGEYKIMASVRALSIGIDEDIRCIIDCALTDSEINHVQWWGRRNQASRWQNTRFRSGPRRELHQTGNARRHPPRHARHT